MVLFKKMGKELHDAFMAGFSAALEKTAVSPEREVRAKRSMTLSESAKWLSEGSEQERLTQLLRSLPDDTPESTINRLIHAHNKISIKQLKRDAAEATGTMTAVDKAYPRKVKYGGFRYQRGPLPKSAPAPWGMGSRSYMKR